ncbi:nicotinate-nucleotide--dimethylbenzimidazole phosphoribosyltransferase [Cryptosporangium aurantiacum]|uniref:Nicotinate-nucleotide--dimethylbenzimidazole phosphoribosyltransferase n=1 Tax=Cryptosporangium aurantiacum TaxID=134849 RepID=A0A1M7R856_9ACTN|nr:nicotinate-nucleotide--dimethylbenzimidazole phosphoribosyltransferase [Cryptosporangium aurantiacum]SHN42342.1 nicotinate-nucleotide--dimethylbenzimidazole phosphoribosyltransferase [Cryptosporangium aurantiacum]
MSEPDVEGAPPPEPEAPPSLLESLTPVAADWAAGEAAEARLSGWGTTTGALAGFARWVGSVRPGNDAPFQRVRLVAFAADHGVTDGAATVHALLAGEGVLPLLARRADVSIRVVDAALAGGPLPGNVSARRVRAGSPSVDRHDPLTPEEVEAALDLGAVVADEEVDAGADLVIPAVATESAIVPATVLIGALSEVEPVKALGYDAYLPDAVWIARCAAVRDGMHRVAKSAATLATRRLLAIGGGADLAAAAGFLVRTAARRTPALLDGVGVAAAALVARALAPDAPGWWCVPHASGRAGEKQAFNALKLRPAMDLGVRLGDGAAALLTLPMLTATVELTAAAPRPAEPEPEPVLPVSTDPDEVIGGVGGYDAGPRGPEEAASPAPEVTTATAPDESAPAPPSADPAPPADPALDAPADPAAVDPADPAVDDPTDPLAVDPEPAERRPAAGVDPGDPALVDPVDPLAVDPEPAERRPAAGVKPGDGAAPSGG